MCGALKHTIAFSLCVFCFIECYIRGVVYINRMSLWSLNILQIIRQSRIMQGCSWHVIIPESGVIMQMHSNYKAGNRYLLASLLVSGKTLNIDLPSVVWDSVSCLEGSTLPDYLIKHTNCLLEISLVNTIKVAQHFIS